MKQYGNHHLRSHGFAIFTAVVMIGILGMALLALTLLFQTDTRRSTRHGVETQLRQLLIAGGTKAVQEVSSGPVLIAGSQLVPLPDAVGDASITIDYEPNDENVMHTAVTATIDNHEAIQTLTFTRTDTGWVLSDIQLLRQY